MMKCNVAVLADGIGLRTRVAELVRRVLGHSLVVQREDDAAGSDRRARIHLPAPGADDPREPQQGPQRLHRRAADQIPQSQHARLPRFSGFYHLQNWHILLLYTWASSMRWTVMFKLLRNKYFLKF